MSKKYEPYKIIDKKTTRFSTKMGNSVKVVYVFRIANHSSLRMGVIITSFNNIVKVSVNPIDNMYDNLDLDYFVWNDDILRIIQTKDACLRDFMKNYSEYRKYTM